MRPRLVPSLRSAALALALAACSGGEEPGEASTRAAAPTHEEVERLRALGYLPHAAAEEADDPARRGVTVHDAARAQPGYNLYDLQNDAVAELADMQGRVVHRFEDPHGKYWARALLLPDGDLVAVGVEDVGQKRREIEEGERYLLRMGWSGEIRWKRIFGAHHDVEALPTGGLLTLAIKPRRIPAIDPAVDVRDDWITEIGPDGSLRSERSLYDMLTAGPFPFRFGDVRRRMEVLEAERRQRGGVPLADHDYVDLLHTNALERLDQPALVGRHPLYQADSLLVTIRHQDRIAVVGLERGDLRWAWGEGELSGPHDASWLPDGSILVFDNGLGRNASRVLEVDPLANAIRWEYRAPDPERFYTASRGSAQRLANGNTLVTNSGAGQAFEITRGGEIVWEFWNPTFERGKRVALGRMRRLDASLVDPLLARFGAAPPSPPPD
jgi:hypothetical protein